MPRDYEALYQLELSVGLGPRWRHQGSTPSFELFTQLLWQGVLAQFMVVDKKARRPAGFVTAYNANHRDGWAYIALAKFDPEDFTGRILEGLAMFLKYLFASWPLRKLYAETTYLNYASFRSGAGRLFAEQGVIEGRDWQMGDWRDVYLLCLDQTLWERWEPVIIPRVMAGERFRQPGGAYVPSSQWADTIASSAEVKP